MTSVRIDVHWCHNPACNAMRDFVNGVCSNAAQHIEACVCGRPSVAGRCGDGTCTGGER